MHSPENGHFIRQPYMAVYAVTKIWIQNYLAIFGFLCSNAKISNKYMGGVDLLDSMLGPYRIRIRSKKWPKKVFFHFLDLCVVNAWILWRKKSDEKKGRPASITGTPKSTKRTLDSSPSTSTQKKAKKASGDLLLWMKTVRIQLIIFQNGKVTDSNAIMIANFEVSYFVPNAVFTFAWTKTEIVSCLFIFEKTFFLWFM